IPPAALASIEPVQLLALEVAARALRDAGYGRRVFDRETTSVIFGAEAGTDLANAYNFRSLYPAYHGTLPGELDAQLPHLTEDSFPGVLANVIAGRIANRLDLGGANYTVDAACASSLAAIDLACKELQAGTSSMVLAGGADVHNSIHDYLMFASVHALSPTGHCRPFDATADGIALGEGVACVVLKRLADAERDGDRIYAVIKGIGSASDGRSRGLTAPRPEGQRRALERAYRMAGISPAQVGLVEAHGTGTVVGDRTELEVLTDVFTGAGAPAGGCVLGSVKSQIGHTKCAAGITGLIKTASAVYTGVYPPTNQLTDPNPAWDPHTSPFTFHAGAVPWTRPGPRIAAVSAFGFGGTNFHTVLSAYTGAPQPSQGLHEWPAELFLFTGPDRPAATTQMTHLAETLAANDSAGRPWRLRDLARSLCPHQAGDHAGDQAGHRVWTAIVAENLDDLATQLTHARSGTTADGVFHATHEGAGQVAMLFPGQGSQRPGMLAELFTTFPHLQRLLDLGHHWSGIMFPPAAFSAEDTARQRAALTDTRVAQPALGIAGLAMYHLLTSLGVHPDHLAGHSYGELVALAAAGALEPTALLELSRARGQAILQASPEDPGTMAAVTAPAPEVQAVLGDGPVVIANHNAPRQTVISGPTPAVQQALGRLHQAGLNGTPIRVACAFHSPLIAAATPRFATDLEGHPITTPRLPVWSNTTATPYPTEAIAIRATLATHVTEPVRFVEQIEAMYAAGVRVFVETGPGRVLTHLVSTILADRPHTALATDNPGHGGLRQLLLTLAELAATGVPIDPTALFHGRDINPIAPHTAPRPSWLINGHRVTTVDGLPLPNGLRPAQPVAVTDPQPQPHLGAPSETGRDAAVREFLRTTRELVATQREIMLGYLGISLPDTPFPETPPGVVQPVPARPTTVEQVDDPAPAEQVVLTPDSVLAIVRSLISERTGYPTGMLDADLDLEADLSIDSIKRAELIGLLTTRLGLASGGALDESGGQELSRLRTLRSIVEWIVEWNTGRTTRCAQAPGTAPAQRLRRYLVEAVALPLLAEPSAASLAGRQVAILGDGVGIALALSVLLERRGAQVRLLDPDQPGEVSGVEALVHLAALDRGRDAVLPEGFTALRAAIMGGVDQLLVVTGSGGRFARTPHANGLAGVGLPGLVRTIAREFPDRWVRVVDVDPKEWPDQLAAQLLSELLSDRPSERPGPGAPTAVGYSAGERITLQPVAAPLAATGSTGLALGPESVVLLTGGARGITAQVAIGLARASGCHLELVGRT
ncbi:MAG: type I polyketide synthase, partial [Pseudonocardiaceae bacterium]